MGILSAALVFIHCAMLRGWLLRVGGEYIKSHLKDGFFFAANPG